MVAFISNEILKEELRFLTHAELVAIPARGTGTEASLVSELSRAGTNQILDQLRNSGAEPCSYLQLLNECMLPPVSLDDQDEISRYAIPLTDEIRKRLALRGADAPACRTHACFLGLEKYPSIGIEEFSALYQCINDHENVFIRRLLEAVYKQLPADKQVQFMDVLKARIPEEQRNAKGLGVAGGALIIGNLGGFGTYMAMSSLLSTLSVGLLPFGAYTAASSAISIVLGPVGWAALAGLAIKQFGAPNKKDLLLHVAQMASARMTVRAENRVSFSHVEQRVRQAITNDRAQLQAKIAALKRDQANASHFLEKVNVDRKILAALRELDKDQRNGARHLEEFRSKFKAKLW